MPNRFSKRSWRGFYREDHFANKVALVGQALVLLYGNRADITHFDHDTRGASTWQTTLPRASAPVQRSTNLTNIYFSYDRSSLCPRTVMEGMSGEGREGWGHPFEVR
jgi:hypothetical protein